MKSYILSGKIYELIASENMINMQILPVSYCAILCTNFL